MKESDVTGLAGSGNTGSYLVDQQREEGASVDYVITAQPRANPPAEIASGRGAPMTPQEENLVDCLNCAMLVAGCPCMFAMLPFICPRDYERAVIFRLGRLRSGGPKGPGVAFVNPLLDEHMTVDLRVVSVDVWPQEILTKDGILSKVDAVVFYHVVDAISSCCNVINFHLATVRMCESSLRSVLSRYTLSELLERRSDMTLEVQRTLVGATANWGVTVDAVEIKNIALPDEMVRTLCTEAESEKLANAKIELSRGEHLAATRLAQASNSLSDPSAVPLRSLKTLVSIAQRSRSTTLVPILFPKDFWSWGGTLKAPEWKGKNTKDAWGFEPEEER